MAEGKVTVTLVITPELDKKFRDAVSAKIGTKHGILGEAIKQALDLYADGLMSGTIRPFEYERNRKNKALISYKDQRSDKSESQIKSDDSQTTVTNVKRKEEPIQVQTIEQPQELPKPIPKTPTPSEQKVPTEVNPYTRYDSMSYQDLSIAVQNVGDLTQEDKKKEYEYICRRMALIIEKSGKVV